MKSKTLTKVVAMLMTLAVLVLALTPTAAAFAGQKGSITLTITNSENGEPIANEAFRLYHFANAHKNGNKIRYDFIDPYDEARIDKNDLNDAYLPVHLAYFAQSRSLPYTEKATDETGKVIFDQLVPGLYLIVPVQNDDDSCHSSPFIISIPEYVATNGKWEFNIIATPKINGNVPDGSTNTYITVLKKWDIDGEHPESIRVVLLRDLQVYETIELNEGNNWYHRWDNLPKDHIWNVIETQVPEGFTVYYETSTNTVIITNSSEESGTTIPSGSEEGTTQPSGGKDDDTDKDDKDDLADTGQLNWPVPVFAISGLLLFSIGWAVLNFSKKENN